VSLPPDIHLQSLLFKFPNNLRVSVKKEDSPPMPKHSTVSAALRFQRFLNTCNFNKKWREEFSRAYNIKTSACRKKLQET
jgi:hypothetical protein